MEKTSVLLISCTVGYGHQAAAMNVEQALRLENPEVDIIHLDTRQYFPPGLGPLSDQWDEQIRRGRFSISQVVKFQDKYEVFYAHFLDWNLSKDLAALFKAHRITAVYDTQPMFTPIFYKAFAKACTDRPMIYHKILTDLPTHRNLHFFGGIKRVPAEGTVQFKVHAPTPLLEPQESVESFWKTHCKLPASNIDTAFALPVHPAYLKPPADIHSPTVTIDPCWNIQLPLPENAFVTTLMLGSQGVNAIYDYATQYLAQLNARNPEQPHYFFIACSKNEPLYASLQQLLADNPLPPTSPHRIIPLTMQNMNALASLMWRSNQIIIRSGGISSLEQLSLAQARKENKPTLWIHSSYKGSDPSALLDHIYAWERGNAEYLMKHLGARMTAPQMIEFFS